MAPRRTHSTWLILGINHEQQHQELIVTDVKNGLWTNPLRPAYRAVPEGKETSTARAASQLDWRAFAGGIYTVGFQGEGFTFDNEGPRHDVYLEPFRLASRLTTNAEYLEFMRDGGDGKRSRGFPMEGLRSHNDGTLLCIGNSATANGGDYTVEGMEPVTMSEPVCHVSDHEADACALAEGAPVTEFERGSLAGLVPWRETDPDTWSRNILGRLNPVSPWPDVRRRMGTDGQR